MPHTHKNRSKGEFFLKLICTIFVLFRVVSFSCGLKKLRKKEEKMRTKQCYFDFVTDEQIFRITNRIDLSSQYKSNVQTDR